LVGEDLTEGLRVLVDPGRKEASGSIAWTLRNARPDRFKNGIVIYSGEQTIPLGNRLWAVPYAELWP